MNEDKDHIAIIVRCDTCWKELGYAIEITRYKLIFSVMPCDNCMENLIAEVEFDERNKER